MSLEREDIAYSIGQRIREFRTRQKLSQEALAFASGLHPAFLGSVERGEKCPSVDTIYKIACGLNVSVTELMDIDSGVKPTAETALHRITDSINKLSEEDALRVADIVENMVKLNTDKN